MNVGIVSYGAYAPYQYIYSENIGKEAARLGLSKKALASWDEDSVTMAVEAGRKALMLGTVDAQKVGALYIGSESPPYAVKPSSTIVADVLGMNNEYRAVDLQFACKAATAGLQMALSEVSSSHTSYGLVIGSDKSQAKPKDALELSAGASAAAVLVGKKNVIAKVIDTVSISSDTPDFWRREHELYPSHGGRFTGEPAYFSHVLPCAKRLLEKTNTKVSDIDYVVFHMPNGMFPVKAAKVLGFSPKQYMDGLTVKEVGNPYSASALLGLSAVLDVASFNKKILMVSYGSGAGSDALLLETTKEIVNLKRGNIKRMFSKRKEASYLEYLQRSVWA